MSWQTKTSRIAYENPWIRVREDEVVRPDGTDGVYGVVEMRNEAVFIVAVDEEGSVLLVEVDRYTVGRSWEVIAGGADGEPAPVAAKRELLEETGLEADDWTEVGRMNALNGVCVATETVFVARGLRQVADAALEQAAEGILSLRRVPLPQALALCGTEITDGETVAALSMAARHLGLF
ncbi:MAG: NUDIX hydrolase [Microbacterium sp.]